MTKPFSLLNEFENKDTSPAHLKKNQIVSLLKEKFDFENSHLKPPNSKQKGILAKSRQAQYLRNEKVIKYIGESGISRFDVASINEIK